MKGKPITEQLSALYGRRREYEVALLTIDRIIAELSEVSVRSNMCISKQDVDALLKLELDKMQLFNRLQTNAPIYLMRDCSALPSTLDALSAGDDLLASYIQEQNEL